MNFRRASMLGFALLLGSCGDIPKARTEGDIEDIATDAANDALGPRLSQLDSKVEELSDEIHSLKRENEALRSRADLDEENINIAFSNHTKLTEAYRDHLRMHGIYPAQQ